MYKLIIFDWGRTLYDNKHRRLFPETTSILKKLGRRYLLAVVSLAGRNNIQRRVEFILRKKINRYFRLILFDIKDKDLLYDSVIKALRVRSINTIVVDDRIIRGIKWGNRHGAKTIWLKRGKFSNER